MGLHTNLPDLTKKNHDFKRLQILGFLQRPLLEHL